MMQPKVNILERMSGTNAGMNVPDGFFEDFNRRMATSLPKQEWETEGMAVKAEPRSRWQKMRPYIYMAAMFMGIWCMMKMFDLMKTADHSDISSNPVLMSAIDNDAFYYDYCIPEISEGDIYDDLYDQGFDPGSMIASANK